MSIPDSELTHTSSAMSVQGSTDVAPELAEIVIAKHDQQKPRARRKKVHALLGFSLHTPCIPMLIRLCCQLGDQLWSDIQLQIGCSCRSPRRSCLRLPWRCTI